jgi:hypothetical protein
MINDYALGSACGAERRHCATLAQMLATAADLIE